MSNILEISHIFKKYQSGNGVETDALSDISFSVGEREMTAVMGSSGSGKTTLIHILSGLFPADAGEIVMRGERLSQMSADDAAIFRRNHVGIVFQNYNLLNSLTVEENILVPLILAGEYEEQERAAELMRLLGIERERKKYPYEISGGQQQRTGICRALVNQPDMIFADEPTGNLDAKAAAQVMECFVAACHDAGAGLLMVTHDAVCASFCERVLFLEDGAIVAEVQRTGDRKSFLERILDARRECVSR